MSRRRPGVFLEPKEARLVVKLIRQGFDVDGSDDEPAAALAAQIEAKLL